MCGLRTGPLADRDPQHISVLDARSDCGSFIDEKLRIRMDAYSNP